MGELCVEIAGLRTAIESPDAAILDLVGERYAGFLAAGGSAWRLRVEADPVPVSALGGEVVVKRGGDPTSFSVERGDFVGAVDLRRRRAAVTLSEVNEFSLDSFLRVAYSLALLEIGGLVVHASSVVRGDCAYLFPGRSGSGKSTVARLSAPLTLLTDELSIVRVAAGRARCYGTPFWGEVARAGVDRLAPLHGVYFLRQAARHAADRVTPRQALRRLLPNVLFFAREPELTGRVLALAGDLVDAVPCFDLSFRLDAGFWEVIADE